MIPEYLAEASNKILIYLTQVLDISEISKDVDERSVEGMTFTTKELKALESITKNNSEPFIPNEIEDIRINISPRPKEIKEIIDLRRIDLDYRIFYLVKDMNEKYYWIHLPHMNHDLHIRRLIKNYRRKSQVEIIRKETRGIRKLRNEKRIRI